MKKVYTPTDFSGKVFGRYFPTKSICYLMCEQCGKMFAPPREEEFDDYILCAICNKDTEKVMNTKEQTDEANI